MRKKHTHLEVSADVRCSICKKPIKLNVLDRQPGAKLCYKHWRKSVGKPPRIKGGSKQVSDSYRRQEDAHRLQEHFNGGRR